MENISAAWLYPVILIAGALQASAPRSTARCARRSKNPWLASIVSFVPIVAFLLVLLFCQPRPLPTAEGIRGMPWWRRSAV